MTPRPDWLDTQAYPFAPHHHQAAAGRMHYVDEGEGAPVVFLHGNPTWSFLYRAPIGRLAGRHRCVAPDLLGFGLSDKPAAWSYQPQDHAESLEEFLLALDLRGITLVMNDWGGPLGLSFALRHPDRVRALAISNTWCWPVSRDPHYVLFSAFMGGPLGRLLIRRRNFFAGSFMRRAFGDASRLGSEVHRHYLAPLGRRQERRGCEVFPRAIVGATGWLAGLAEQLPQLPAELPVLLLWGMRDIAFREKELHRWQGIFPQARTVRCEAAGHFVAEEEPEVFSAELERFLDEVVDRPHDANGDQPERRPTG